MDSPVILFALVAVVIVGFAIFGIIAAARRRKELAALALSHGLRFSSDHDDDLGDRFAGFDCLNKGSKRYGYNIMMGEWNGWSLLAFDYHYETYSTDSKGRRTTHHHRFSAVILESKIPLKGLFIRPEGFFDKFAEFFGYDDIDFESAEFSRKFYVKSTDRRWAYDVIHQRTMEFLLAMPRFTIKFDHGYVIAYRSGKFKSGEFFTAAEVIAGILDRLPEYLVRQQTGRG